MRLPVYIAASSADHARAKSWARKLEASGLVRVTGEWWTAVEHHGIGNDAALSDAKRREYAAYDLGGVAEAAVFWALWSDAKSEGRAVELGYAVSSEDHRIVISGPSRASIFTALGVEFATDEEAFEHVLGLAREWVKKPIAGSEAGEVT